MGLDTANAVGRFDVSVAPFWWHSMLKRPSSNLVLEYVEQVYGPGFTW